ncbi:MAG: hypothetical protein H6710_16155 [Myxococcales bacterium]|nr:hypothetical protein [Myxococcales bacterium]
MSTGELRLSHHTRPFAADVMSGLRGRLCRRLGALIEAPLFPTIGGEVIGLAALLRSAAARPARRSPGGTAPLHGVIRYALVAPGSFPELGGPPVLALQLSELREAIVPLFGADALEERGLGTLAALAARPRRAPAAASTAASRAAVRPAPTTTPVARPRPARAPEPAAVEALTDELVDFLEVEVEASPATTRDADARRLEFDALLEV